MCTALTLSLSLAYHFAAPVHSNFQTLSSFSVGKIKNQTHKWTSSLEFRITPPPPLSLLKTSNNSLMQNMQYLNFR